MLDEMKDIPNWTLRFINLWQTRYNSFINLRNKYDYTNYLNNIPQSDRIKYCESFKKLFEAAWKVLKYKMRDNGIKNLFPREIFINAEKLGYIKDADTMLEFIYDFNDITDISFSNNDIGNKFITKVENLYFPWILIFQEKMQKEFYDIFEKHKDFYLKYCPEKLYLFEKIENLYKYKQHSSYYNWYHYFSNTFIEKNNNYQYLIKKIKDISYLSDEEKSSYISETIDMFNSSVLLLRYYLKFNGIFYYENIDIIKEAYYLEIIEDGQSWIELLFDIKNIEQIKADNKEEELLHNIVNKYAKCFSDLNIFMEKKYEKLWY